MKVEYINAFTKSISNIAQSTWGTKIDIGSISAGKTPLISAGILITVGVNKDLEGQIIYAFTEITAVNMASKMMGGMQVTSLDEMARSALQEAFNWISAGAATTLEGEMNTIIDITPPLLQKGQVELYSTGGLILTVPVIIDDVGTIEINISLVAKK